MKRRRRARICRCGHEKSFHPNGGACTYGRGTASGGCIECPRYHTTKIRENATMPVKTYKQEAETLFAPTDVDAIVAKLDEAERAIREVFSLLRHATKQAPTRVLTPHAVMKIATGGKYAADDPPAILRRIPPPVPTRTEARAKAKTMLADVSRKTTIGGLSPCARSLLGTLVQWSPGALSADFLAIFTGYSVKSGGFGSALAALRKRGLIGGTNDAMKATEEGRALMPSTPIPTGPALLDMWRERLDPCSTAILSYLVRWGVRSVEEIANGTGYSAKSGGFGSALSKLRKLRLIEGSSDALMCSRAFLAP